jgi:hypothetical protein
MFGGASAFWRERKKGKVIRSSPKQSLRSRFTPSMDTNVVHNDWQSFFFGRKTKNWQTLVVEVLQV